MPNSRRALDLLNECAIKEAVPTTATGTSTIQSSVIDTAGYEGVLFIVKITTAAANNTIKGQDGAASDGSDAADLLGTSVALGGASDEILVLQIKRSRNRYVRCAVVRGTTTVIEWGVAILFGPRSAPVANILAGTLAAESHVSPAQGTA